MLLIFKIYGFVVLIGHRKVFSDHAIYIIVLLVSNNVHIQLIKIDMYKNYKV